MAAAGERGGRDAELLREARGDAVATRLEVDDRTSLPEAPRAGDPADLVGERLDPARDLARVVDVAGAVEDVDADLPRRRRSALLAAAARLGRPLPGTTISAATSAASAAAAAASTSSRRPRATLPNGLSVTGTPARLRASRWSIRSPVA
jgi:hypothetical protein